MPSQVFMRRGMSPSQVAWFSVIQLEVDSPHSSSTPHHVPLGTPGQSALKGCCFLHVGSNRDEYKTGLISFWIL